MISDGLVYDSGQQHRLFDAIAGMFMGRSAKRGLPYTWIPVHLADAFGEVSPRTFLKAMRTAAHHTPAPTETAVDHRGIEEGVRAASEERLRELKEDYSWVSVALEPMRGLAVPCERAQIVARWAEAKTVETIKKAFKGRNAPVGLVGNKNGELDSLLTGLEEIGVIEIRDNGKINVPDIFRVNAGILRRGGVTPQQRRKL